jgi:predicted transposase YbfD/YdcC
MRQFRACFAELSDPRAANASHDLTEILFIALAAVLCGAEDCSDMAEFGCAKEALLRQILRLEHGIPSHDTFSRVFRLLDPAAFEAAFRRFTSAFAQEVQGVVAIDGKAVRGAFERGRRSTPLHLVNVWAADQRLALAQRLAPNRNEVAGALEVVGLLSLEGCIVTADAMHCHAAMAQAVLDRGGDYALALKDNQPVLLAEAEALLNKVPAERAAEQVDRPAKHGRHERRVAVVAAAGRLAKKSSFPGLAAVARVTTCRSTGDKEEEPLVRYFVLSKRFSPERALAIVRSHWTIENQLHWVLDVVFDEDGARNRKGHGPENLSTMRKLALNLLRSHPYKASVRRKVKRAGWDDAFLLSLLGQMR